MATVLHLSDTSNSTRSHKILTQKKRHDGFEAPRNSMEFPLESYQGYHEIYENIPFSCVIKNPSRLGIIPSGTPVKKLIDEEMSSKANCRRNAPSVVARLMGMDSLPSETSTSSERPNAISRNTEQRPGYGKAGSVQYKPFDFGPLFGLQREEQLLCKNVVTAASTISPRAAKPQRREHPQEQQLQEFKKEFEAWLSKKKWEQNMNDGLDRSPPGWKEHSAFPQGNMHEEKSASHVSSQQKFPHRKASSFSDFDHRKQRVGFYHETTNAKYHSNPVKPASENRMPWSNIRGFQVEETTEKLDESLPTANIVILKPNAEYIDDFRETWANSPEIVEKVGSIEHFLEEVKERLRLEVQGKPTLDGTTQGSIEGPVRKGKRTDPKQIAQHIARQIRESISKDIEVTLMRSKSSRTNKTEERHSLSESSVSISKETKRTFLKRLKNTHDTMEANVFPVDPNGKRNTQVSAKKVIRLIPPSECLAEENLSLMNLSNISNQLKKGSTRSFRLEDEDDATFPSQPSSLSRSYSAPITGTVSGKLLFENQHILTGDHVTRKHELDGNVSTTTTKKLRDGFNFKNKVSNLRHNLTLKHKLFNKKPSVEEQLIAPRLDSEEISSAVLPMNVGRVKDNSTEVPPSPVSISSSSPDDFFKHASPVSPLDIPFHKEHSSPQVSEGIASSVPDQSPLHTIDDTTSEASSSHVRAAYEDEIGETYSNEEAYIQEILLAVGLYQRGSSSATSPRWDVLSRTVPSWVFEEVEKTYENNNDQLEGGSVLEASSVNRKMLFDLLNEALPVTLKPPVARTALKWSISVSRKIPRGKELLDAVWHEMLNLTPCFAEPYSIENLVVHDICRKSSWSIVVEDEMDALGDDIASMILEQLIDNFLLDV